MLPRLLAWLKQHPVVLRSLGVASLLGAALLYFTLVWVPAEIKARAERMVPGVQVLGDVSWNPNTVTLNKVQVTKDWVKGRVGLVRVHYRINWKTWQPDPTGIEFRGGHLDVDYLKKPRSPVTVAAKEARKADLLAKVIAFELDSVKATMGDYQGVARNIRLTKEGICCAEAGVVLDPSFRYSLYVKDNRIDVRDLCLNIKTRVATVREVSTTIKPPWGIPGVSGDQDVLVREATVDMKASHIESDTLVVGDLFEAHGVELENKDGVIDLKASGLASDHKWFSAAYTLYKDDRPARNHSLFKDIHLTVPLPTSTERIATAEASGVKLVVDMEEMSISGEASCNDWALALPEPKQEALGKPDFFKGDLSFSVGLKGLMPKVELKQTCQAKCDEALIASLKDEIAYYPIGADGKPFRRRLGPGTGEDWVKLESLPEYVPQAFITKEDPSFHKHGGILRASVMVAIQKNLQLGRFDIGGSTITQQLAKNIWLSRSRSITRKAQEALLTLALESCLSKEDILELYMNAVEYAPDVYGIENGAYHYFNKHARDLEPVEAYYLVKLLPNPKKATPPDKGGLEQARILMTRLALQGRIPEALVPVVEVDETEWDAAE